MVSINLTISVLGLTGELAEIKVTFDREADTLLDLRKKVLKEMKEEEMTLPKEKDKCPVFYFERLGWSQDLYSKALTQEAFGEALDEKQGEVDGKPIEFNVKYMLDDRKRSVNIKHLGSLHPIRSIKVDREAETIDSFRRKIFYALDGYSSSPPDDAKVEQDPTRTLSFDGFDIKTDEELRYVLDSMSLDSRSKESLIHLSDSARQTLKEGTGVQNPPKAVIPLPVAFGIAGCVALSVAAGVASVGAAAVGVMVTLAVIAFFAGMVGTSSLQKKRIFHVARRAFSHRQSGVPTPSMAPVLTPMETKLN